MKIRLQEKEIRTFNSDVRLFVHLIEDWKVDKVYVSVLHDKFVRFLISNGECYAFLYLKCEGNYLREDYEVKPKFVVKALTSYTLEDTITLNNLRKTDLKFSIDVKNISKLIVNRNKFCQASCRLRNEKVVIRLKTNKYKIEFISQYGDSYVLVPINAYEHLSNPVYKQVNTFLVDREFIDETCTLMNRYFNKNRVIIIEECIAMTEDKFGHFLCFFSNSSRFGIGKFVEPTHVKTCFLSDFENYYSVSVLELKNGLEKVLAIHDKTIVLHFDENENLLYLDGIYSVPFELVYSYDFSFTKHYVNPKELYEVLKDIDSNETILMTPLSDGVYILAKDKEAYIGGQTCRL